MAEALTPQHADLIVGQAAAEASLSRWLRIGWLIVAATFGIGLGWAALAPLSSAVVASGIVKVETDRKKIQHPEGGVVQAIFAKEGMHVKAGDVLVRLDATKAGSGYGMVRGGRDVALATLARLTAERDDLPAIAWPPELKAREADPQVADILRSQTQLFQARRNSLQGELNILAEQTTALRSEISGLESQQRSKEEQMASLKHDLDSLLDLEKHGMVEKTRVRSVEREHTKLLGERDEIVARIAQARTAISEKGLRRFQLRKAFSEEVVAELKKVQAEGFELQERETAAKRTLEQTELRAPVDGTITELRVHTAGGVIAPGEVLMELVPSSDRLVVEARVMPQDVDRVAVGLPASLKLHAFGAQVSTELDARVSYVSADAAADPRTEQTWFTVRLDVAPEALDKIGSQNKVVPGMQTDVFIRTGQRTFLGYLMQPLSDSFRRAWRER